MSDMIYGVDISKIWLKNLREKIGIIPHYPTLFEGTLRQNIDPYNKASNSEIIELLKHASLENLIERHIKGLDQQIEAKAYNLFLVKSKLYAYAEQSSEIKELY